MSFDEHGGDAMEIAELLMRAEAETERVHAELTEYGNKYAAAERELDQLRARVAELEASEVEYGIRLPNAAGDVKSWGSDLAGARKRLAGLHHRFDLAQRRVLPWTPVEDEAGA